ncbi:MAG: hypothetical protein ACAH10_01635 [Methylophilaceae bacterium]
MTKIQKILLLLTVINLAIIFLFPPYDDNSINHNGIGIFSGFLFAFSHKPENFVINSSFLYLEVAVVIINLCILLLLTIENARRTKGKKFNFRNASILLVVINLVGVLLFPPFEYISHMTRAVIPTFEGFYFVFDHPPYRAIVTPLLYLEVFVVLINGCLMLLVFKGSKADVYTAEDALSYAAKLKAAKSKNIKL